MEIVIIWLLFGIISAVVGSNKGRSGCGWFLLGVLLGPFGLILALVVPKKRLTIEQSAIENGDIKKCPFCAEFIKSEAIKCRYCGSALIEDAILSDEESISSAIGLADTEGQVPDYQETDFVRKERDRFVKHGIPIGIILFLVLAAVAVPQFSAYRIRSYDTAAQADLRNAATAQEAYFLDYNKYSSSIEALTGAGYGLYLSDGVTISIQHANNVLYQMMSFHERGSKKYSITGPNGTIEQTGK